MTIRERLWGVLRERGYGSIEEMARGESERLGIQIPAGTLYSWMTDKGKHRRRPWHPRSLRTISLITGVSIDVLVREEMEEDVHSLKGRR